MNGKTLFLCILAGLMLSGCAADTPLQTITPDVDQQLLTLGVAPYQTATPFVADEPADTAAPSPTTAGCPAPYQAASTTRTSYQLYAFLGVAEHAGYFEEQISFPNYSGEPISELFLVVEPNWIEGAFSLSGLEVESAQPDHSLAGGLLQIPLETPLPDGCQLDAVLTYHLEVPEREGIFGYTEDQLVLTNWYPFVPPYQAGRGWLVHLPGDFGEHLVYPIADFDVTLELANPPADVLVAAPAPAEGADGRYSYSLQGARTFSLAVLSGYFVRERQYNGIDVTVYAKQATIAAVQDTLDTAVDSLAYFEEVFGPYPFESLSIVQLQMYDGLESDGIFFLSNHVFGTYNAGPRNMLIYLVPHEVSHNWWYSQVANDQALEPWLDEALATYCEKLFYEQAFPAHAAWWWEYRINQWDPDGFVDGTIYSYRLYEQYRQAVYLRGVEFIHALRLRMGDEAFLAFLRSYLEHGRYQVVTADDFFSLLEDEYQVQLDDLIAEFFQNR